MWAKKRAPLIISLLISLLIGGCRPDEPTLDLPEQSVIHQVKFVRYSPDCETDSTRCAVFKVYYPSFDSSQTLIRLRINRTIHNKIIETIGEDTGVEDSAMSLEQMAESFFRDYAMFARGGAYSMPWVIECKGEVLNYSNRVFSLSIDSYRFTGGAHPNKQVNMFNFDLEKGNILNLEDILIDQAAFKKLAEKEFRATHQLEAEESLVEAGFFWKNGYEPANNFALTNQGLLLYYNTYEIAPYSKGITQYVLPYSELEGIIDPAFIVDTNNL